MACHVEGPQARGPVPPGGLVCVRWLGAFGRAPSFEALVGFERSPTRHVSAALAPAGCRPAGAAKVGLLVDEQATGLVVAFAGDAWTPTRANPRGALGGPARGATARTWRQARALRPEGGPNMYRECMLVHPRYSAVVFVPGDEGARLFAERVGKALGLPTRAWR